MAGAKETPRQKMIGMMYLVLTAMLALNISRQVLQAFVVVNDGLIKTNSNFDTKNVSVYQLFDKAYKDDSAKVGKFRTNAYIAQRLSAKFCKYIDSLKAALISHTDKIEFAQATKTTLNDVASKENFDDPTRIMINDAAAEDGHLGEAHKLKLKIMAYRKQMLNLVSSLGGDTASVNIGLLTPDVTNPASREKENWEVYNFYDSPLAASIVTLSHIQNDVKYAEGSVIGNLFKQIDLGSYKFNSLEAKVIPQSNYVVQGDSFKSDIFLTAFQSTQNPEVHIDSVNNRPEEYDVPVSSGMGHYGVRTSTEGAIEYQGWVGIKNPKTGGIDKYFFNSSYVVAKPSVVVSPTKMNVFYIGVPNPVEVSAAGFAEDKITPSLSGPGSMTGSKGSYIVTLSTTGAHQGDVCKISVTGTMPSGSKKALGTPQEFRVKRVPDPTCYVANKKGDINISKEVLSSATQVQARLENFDFELNYEVTSFDMVVSVNGLTVTKTSPSKFFTDEMKRLITQCGHGSHIIIQNVRVKSSFDARTIPGVNIAIN